MSPWRFARSFWVVSCLILSLGPTASAWARKDQEAQSDELKVLDRLTGDWEETMRFSDGTEATGKGSSKWVLGNTFVQSNFSIELPGGRTVEHLALYTWNPEKKAYASWVFGMGSAPLESTATWEKDKETLTFTSVPNAAGVVTKSVMHFAKPDAIEWKVESKGKDGQAVFAVQGTDKRVKK